MLLDFQSNDLSQSNRQEVINLLNRRNWRREISPGGFCNGDSLMWSLYMYDGKEQNYKALNDLVVSPHLNLKKLETNHLIYINKYHKNNFHDTPEKTEEIKKDHEKYLKIMKYYNNIMFGQKAYALIENATQKDYAKIINLAENIDENAPDAFIEEFYMPFVVSKSHVINLLYTLIPPHKIISLGEPRHAISIYYDGERYHFFDPNSEIGSLSAKRLENIEFQILKGLNEDYDEPYIAFEIAIIDKRNNINKFNYPPKVELLNLSIYHNIFNTKRNVSILDQTALNDHDLFKIIFTSHIKNPNLINDINLINLFSKPKNLDLYHYAKTLGFSFSPHQKSCFIKMLIKNQHVVLLQQELNPEKNDILLNYLRWCLEYNAGYEIFNIIANKLGGVKALAKFFQSESIDWTNGKYVTLERNIVHFVAHTTDPIFLNFLFENYPNLATKIDFFGRDHFQAAVAAGNVILAKYLINKKIIEFKYYQNDLTLLDFAIKSANSHMLKYLFDQGMTAQSKPYLDREGNSLLHIAMMQVNWKMLPLLLQENMHLKNKAGLTPFEVGLEYGNIRLINYMLDNGVYTFSQNKYYLIHAWKAGSHSFILKLLDKELKLRSAYKIFKPYLVHLVINNHIDAINAFRMGDFLKYQRKLIDWIEKQDNPVKFYYYLENEQNIIIRKMLDPQKKYKYALPEIKPFLGKAPNTVKINQPDLTEPVKNITHQFSALSLQDVVQEIKVENIEVNMHENFLVHRKK